MSTPINIIIDSKSLLEDLESCSIQMSDSNFCFSVSISLKSDRFWKVCDPDLRRGQLRIKVAIGSDIYQFFCEERSTSASPSGMGFSIWGRSAQAVLAKPFSETIQDNDDTVLLHIWRLGAYTASQVVDYILDTYAPSSPSPQISVDWNTDDYLINRHALLIEGKTIIEVIQMLASAIGAEVRPSIDGNLSVEEYSVSEIYYEENYTDLDDIVSIDEEILESSGFNKIVVHGYDPAPDDSEAETELSASILTTGTIYAGREVRVKVPYYHSKGKRPVCYFPNGSSQLVTSFDTEQITEMVALVWGHGNYSFTSTSGEKHVTGDESTPFDFQEVTYSRYYQTWVLRADTPGEYQAMFYFEDKEQYTTINFTVVDDEDYWGLTEVLVLVKHSPDNPVGGDSLVLRAYGAYSSELGFTSSCGNSVTPSPGVVTEEVIAEQVTFSNGRAVLTYPIRRGTGYPQIEFGSAYPGLDIDSDDIKWGHGSNILLIEKLVDESEYESITANITYKTGYRQYALGIPEDYATEYLTVKATSSDDSSLYSEITVTVGSAGPPRTVTLYVKDYVSDVAIQGVSVYIDNDLKGQTDANGKIEIADVSVGDHTLKLTKSGYIDSDQDDLDNDDFTVTAP